MKKKIDKSILILLIIFSIISVVTIYCSEKLLIDVNYYYIKQIIWYLIGFLIIFLIIKFGNDGIYKHAYILYIISNILLLLLLIFADPINDAKCWFTIKGIGTIQPSEFTKIALIIVLAKECDLFKKKFENPNVKDEFKFLLKIILILMPPSLLTFLEPDTGVVLIYFLITIIMLFITGIRIRWFVMLGLISSLFIGLVLGIYFLKQDLFISIFGNSFFLRVNRLLDWSNKSGYQLENSLVSIGSAGLFGHGFNIKLYIPEPQTDFIFAVYASVFGIVGSLVLLSLISIFDIKIINLGLNTKKNIDRYTLAGIVGMLIYQQFQNIGMTFGLMPITGITLPFISYGGSSLLSYMIMMGLVFNISKH